MIFCKIRVTQRSCHPTTTRHRRMLKLSSQLSLTTASSDSRSVSHRMLTGRWILRLAITLASSLKTGTLF